MSECTTPPPTCSRGLIMDGVIVAAVCLLSTLPALQTMNALRYDRLAAGKHTTMSWWRHVKHDVCSLQELCDKPTIAYTPMLFQFMMFATGVQQELNLCITDT